MIHPYPALLTDNITKWSKRIGSIGQQMEYTIREIDQQTRLYNNPEIMKDIEQFPNKIHLDHNELARRLLDKIS